MRFLLGLTISLIFLLLTIAVITVITVAEVGAQGGVLCPQFGEGTPTPAPDQLELDYIARCASCFEVTPTPALPLATLPVVSFAGHYYYSGNVLTYYDYLEVASDTQGMYWHVHEWLTMPSPSGYKDSSRHGHGVTLSSYGYVYAVVLDVQPVIENITLGVFSTGLSSFFTGYQSLFGDFASFAHAFDLAQMRYCLGATDACAVVPGVDVEEPAVVPARVRGQLALGLWTDDFYWKVRGVGIVTDDPRDVISSTAATPTVAVTPTLFSTATPTPDVPLKFSSVPCTNSAGVVCTRVSDYVVRVVWSAPGGDWQRLPDSFRILFNGASVSTLDLLVYYNGGRLPLYEWRDASSCSTDVGVAFPAWVGLNGFTRGPYSRQLAGSGVYRVRFKDMYGAALYDMPGFRHCPATGASPHVYDLYVVIEAVNGVATAATPFSEPTPTPTPTSTPTLVPWQTLDCTQVEYRSPDPLLSLDVDTLITPGDCHTLLPDFSVHVPDLGPLGGGYDVAWPKVVACIQYVHAPEIAVLGFTVPVVGVLMVAVISYVISAIREGVS